MDPFTLTLPNKTRVTGLRNIPTISPTNPPPKHTPLIVALHGGSYHATYFSASSRYTALTLSNHLSIPFLSLNRPGYGGTSSILPLPPGLSFAEASAEQLHRHILPALWTEYGIPNQCTAIVLLCHSLGGMPGTIVAAMHARDAEKMYPLAGLIVSGMGNTQTESAIRNRVMAPNADGERVKYPLDVKDALMFHSPDRTTDAEILQLAAKLDHEAPFAEIECLPNDWLPRWKQEWAAEVRVPVLWVMSGLDLFFVASKGEVDVCLAAFKKSERVEGGLVQNAPHCLELSHWSAGWYARCFGWAIECAASFAVEVCRCD